MMECHRKSWLAASFLAAAITTPAVAQIPPPAEAPETGKPASPGSDSSWFSSIKLSAQFEGGATINSSSPENGLNFGQLFTDRANQASLNQALLSVQRLPDPKATDYDFGFQLQALYGSDARYTQFMGELNSAFASRYQLAFINANLQAHLPWLTPGGIDVKAGQYTTPLGFETIDPSTNPFYSHSYIFNFGLPFVHTGVLTTTHVTSMLDVYAGIDSGVNTTLGAGDNNGAAAGLAGVNLTLLDGALTILALTHFGPENPTRTVPGANGAFRYENDVAITYKATDKLTLVTELNWIRDDKFSANGFGAAQYASYAVSDTVTLNGRAEIWRDDNGFFVGAFPGNHDFINVQYGFPATVLTAGPATYSEFTLGFTYKPTLPLPAVSSLMVRPEVRYDRTLTTTRAYNDFTDRGQFTFAADVVIGF
jgi:hypothetical protein